MFLIIMVFMYYLYCVMYSVLVVGVVIVGCWLWLRCFWIFLLGWWFYILIDVFIYLVDFYLFLVFYLVIYWGFDGIVWNILWFMVVNYLVMLVVVIVMFCYK